MSPLCLRPQIERRIVGNARQGKHAEEHEWSARDLDEIFEAVDRDRSGTVSLKEISRALAVDRNAEFRSVRYALPREPELAAPLAKRTSEVLWLAERYDSQMKGQDVCPASFRHALELYYPNETQVKIQVCCDEQEAPA